MSRVLQLDNKTNITIDTDPCGSGGSGEVYKILSPINLTNQVVKLYHKERLTKEAEEKIKKPLITNIDTKISKIESIDLGEFFVILKPQK